MNVDAVRYHTTQSEGRGRWSWAYTMEGFYVSHFTYSGTVLTLCSPVKI